MVVIASISTMLRTFLSTRYTGIVIARRALQNYPVPKFTVLDEAISHASMDTTSLVEIYRPNTELNLFLRRREATWQSPTWLGTNISIDYVI